MKNDFFKSVVPDSPNIRIYTGYGLRVHLDKNKVIPDDPGQDTPAMVYKLDKYGYITHSATYWCCSDTGELAGHNRWGTVINLSDRQVAWLQRLENDIVSFLYPSTVKEELKQGN